MTRKRFILCGAVVAAACAVPVASFAAADYRFDPVHTQIHFCVDHMGFSQSCGSLHVKSGFFHFDEGDWPGAKVEAVIDAASLDLGDAAWSEKVRSSFLDAKVYPTMRYVGKSVDKTGAREGVVHGALTLLGRTRAVDLKVTFNRAGADGYTLRYVAGFSATASFKRSAFGIDRDARDIGDRIDVRIEVEGLRDKDAQAQASGPDRERSAQEKSDRER